MFPTDVDIPKYMVDLIHQVAKQEGFTDYTYNCTSGSNHADGFLGLVARITITGEQNGKSGDLSLIFKVPPLSEIRRKEMPSDMVFQREIDVYNDFLTTINKFQKDKHLTPETGFFSFPKCYATIADKENDIYCLVLEDLKASGYVLWNKLETIEVDQVELVLKEQAKLHGISFALRDQQPEVFEKFLSYNDLFTEFSKIDFFDTIKDVSFDLAIASLNPDNVEAIEKMEIIKKKFVEITEECTNWLNADPFMVINHGDSWTNNMMFSYNEDGKTFGKVCFIDWQICRAASPILDIVYFLYSTTHKPLRDAHYNDLIRTYYNTLANTIRAAGSDPDKLFTFDDLQNQFKKFGKFGLAIAPLLLQTTTTDPKDIPDIDEVMEGVVKGEENAFNFNTSNKDKYNERMRDVILDCIKLGYV